MKTGYKVGDAMTMSPIVVSPDITVKSCAKKMLELGVGSLLIKKKNDEKLLGIITEKDIVEFMAHGKNPDKTKAKSIMKKELITIEPKKDIFDAIVLMRDKKVRRLPVVYRNRLVGMLTLKDILRIQPQLLEIIVEKFEIREEYKKPVSKRLREGICQLCGEYGEDLANINGYMLCESCRES